MRVWIAVVCCVLVAGLAASVPRDVLAGSLAYVRWVHLLVVVAIIVDARRVRLSDYAAGLGTRNWVLWVALLGWPLVAVPWYLTLREWIRAGRMPRRAALPQRIDAQVV